MAERPETTIRKTIGLSERLWDAIDEFRHAERIRTEVEAIRRLLELGLEAAERGGGRTRWAASRRRT